jgi:murein L,D-transpeptidase YafK
MKIILALILSLNAAFATSFLYAYRTGGLERVHYLLEQEQKSAQFWEEALETLDTTYGYFENKSHLLIANKMKPSLNINSFSDDNSFKNTITYDAIVGKNGGDKQKEGDLKTPTGVYRLTQKLTKVDQFYGPLAFVTSYPNIYDKSQNKNGSGIWIHGHPLNGDREKATKGCIAIQNKELIDLSRQIEYKDALLLSYGEGIRETSKNELAQLLASLFQWKEAWKEGDFESYINFYDKEFKRKNGTGFKAFKKYKQRIFARNEKKFIQFNDIFVMPYPDTKDLFIIGFHEIYKTRNYKFDGFKEIFAKLDSNGKMKIIAE